MSTNIAVWALLTNMTILVALSLLNMCMVVPPTPISLIRRNDNVKFRGKFHKVELQ